MEVEIKASINNLENVKNKLKEMGAKILNENNQIDIYYNSPAKDFRKTNEYLRIRENSQKKYRLEYHISIGNGISEEYEVDIGNLETIKTILDKLGFKVLGKIDKKRTNFEYEDFVISIDDVKDIGKFIEIELDCKDKNKIEEFRNRCLKLLDKIGINRNNVKNVWLADIATGKTKL